MVSEKLFFKCFLNFQSKYIQATALQVGASLDPNRICRDSAIYLLYKLSGKLTF